MRVRINIITLQANACLAQPTVQAVLEQTLALVVLILLSYTLVFALQGVLLPTQLSLIQFAQLVLILIAINAIVLMYAQLVTVIIVFLMETA